LEGYLVETNIQSRFSLLWPNETVATEKNILSENAGNDLGLYALIDHLRFPSHLRARLRDLLLSPVTGEETIRFRQDVLEDCLNHPQMITRLEELLPRLAHLGYLADYPFQSDLERVTARLGELEIYVECVRQLSDALDEGSVSLHSAGLLRLRDRLRDLESGSGFQDLFDRLPELRKKAAGAASVSIGVNLDHQLRPFEATLLSINDRPYTGSSDTFLSRLLRKQDESFKSNQEFRGIARLHTVPANLTDDILQGYMAGQRSNPLVAQIFQDLDFILHRTIDPIARALKQFINYQSHFLIALELELAFYLSAARLVQQMQTAGLPMCRVEIAPAAERIFEAHDLYNLALAQRLNAGQSDLNEVVVTNDALFGEEGRILILTGPNQGGKTTFTQAVGLAQALFQVGFYVPARQARFSPADCILTLFPLEERQQANIGRLGEEAQRLSQIFKHATRHSLVLLNEALTTTSPGESIYLARDILRALRLYGVRAIFVTHLHELAENIDTLHATSTGDSKLASLVAGILESDHQADAVDPEAMSRRSFKIRPAPPMGVSYARDIARRHGISYEQLANELKERQANA
jgi:DNA mismatch repair protein MutS